jgi:enamine deaminase RidA (YjgF/YER057c/UK114 family)
LIAAIDKLACLPKTFNLTPSHRSVVAALRHANKGNRIMNRFRNSLIASAVAAVGFCAFAGGAVAQQIVHNQENPESPFASSVIVPPGYTTYYISGSGPTVADPNAPKGSVESLGNTATQTASTLVVLKDRLTKLGLTFGDVVQARVFLAADPTNGGKMDFAGMNGAWLKVFGTADQPNKPARATFQAANLVVPGALVEIEFVAAKKVKSARGHAK